jgi:hypothetical protein
MLNCRGGPGEIGVVQGGWRSILPPQGDWICSAPRKWRDQRSGRIEVPEGRPNAALRSRVVAPLRRARAPCLQRRSLATDRQSGYQTGPSEEGNGPSLRDLDTDGHPTPPPGWRATDPSPLRGEDAANRVEIFQQPDDYASHESSLLPNPASSPLSTIDARPRTVDR